MKMKCMSCRYDAMTDATATYFAQVNNCYIIIENVPCKKCPQCGEEYFSASVMERIDVLLDKVERLGSKVSIFDYQAAA